MFHSKSHKTGTSQADGPEDLKMESAYEAIYELTLGLGFEGNMKIRNVDWREGGPREEE